MRILIAFLFICGAHAAFSQPVDDGKRDNIWLFGYDSYSQLPGFGRTVIDFTDLNAPYVYREDRDMDFRQTCSIICGTNGEMLFYTNGIYVANSEHEEMENGDSLNPSGWTSSFPNGLPVSQGIITLPISWNENKYILFHGQLDFPAGLGPIYSNFYYSRVDMGLDGGLGAVTEKNVELVQDTLFRGKITAVRHGNGRDWWVIIPEHNTNRYYTFLLTPDSLYNMGAQAVGTPVYRGVGQAVFTPDGSRYLRYDLHAAGEGNNLNLYDFDRCTGLLSNQIELVNFDSVGAAGLAVSANSRFAYFITSGYVRQYDLWAPDLASSLDTVAVYDGFVSPWGHNTWFYLAQLAPDNKIYVNTPSGSNFLHIIHEPDRKGQSCEFEQHGLEMPSRNAFSMPNFPYFRLGPLDGSPCDTLGIDNVPMARFRYRKDTVNLLRVAFTDLSYYEPANWNWNFGDNTTSQDTSPVHTFQEDGVYEVCLTVGNGNGEGTSCKTLYFGTTANNETKRQKKNVLVYPNPSSGWLIVQSLDAHMQGEFILSDLLGRETARFVLKGWEEPQKINLNDLPSGICLWRIETYNKLIDSGKISIIK
jgi:PKD domain